MFAKSYCGYCARAKGVLEARGIPFHSLDLDTRPDGAAVQEALYSLTQQRTVPNLFIQGQHLGGSTDLEEAARSGRLAEMLRGHREPEL